MWAEARTPELRALLRQLHPKLHFEDVKPPEIAEPGDVPDMTPAQMGDPQALARRVRRRRALHIPARVSRRA